MSNTENAAGERNLLFPVSIPKLVVMSIFTLGIYDLYWIYANWVRIRNRECLSISPALRTMLALFFIYPLFSRIRGWSVQAGVQAFPAALLAIGWIVTSVGAQILPAPYSLLALLAFVFFVPVQTAVNRTNLLLAPQHSRNARLTVWNWLVVLPGVLLLALVLIGLVWGGR